MEPLLRRLRDERVRLALRVIPFAGRVRAKVSAYADDITVFVSCRIDILAVKEVVARYEKVAGAKVNFDKSEGLRLGALRGAIPLPGPFRRSNGTIRIFGVWFGPGLQLERNWSEVRAKVEARVATWLLRLLSLKGKAKVCAVYIFPLILYRLSVLPLPKDHRAVLIQCLFKCLWRGGSPLVLVQVCYQRPRNGGLGMPDLDSHWLAERLAYLGRSLTKDTVWGHKMRNVFLYLKSNPKAEARRRPGNDIPFVRKCRRALHKLPRSSDLSQSRNELYRELVAGTTLDPLEKQPNSQWNWAPGMSILNNSEFSLTWRLARDTLALNDWAYRACILDITFRRNGLARLLLLQASSPVLESRRGVDGSHQPQTARAARRWLRRGQCYPSVSGWEA